MAITTTITDSGDGTGGVVAVAGSTIGSTNTLYRAAWDGRMTSYAMTSAGSRVGDGNIAVATLGYALWQVVSVDGATVTVGPVVYQNLTAPTSAFHYSILEAVRVVITSLSLDGVDDVSVQRKWLPTFWSGIHTSPLVQVAPFGAEGDESRLLNKDDVVYPVIVAFADPVDNGTSVNQNRNLLWRQQVAGTIRHQRLEGVPGVINTKVTPVSIVDPTAFGNNVQVGAIVFNFVHRQVRGFPGY